MASPVDLLRDRLRRDPARPLLTQYRGSDRTELSTLSFANWVDKTAHWLADEDLADLFDPVSDPEVVGLELAAEQPAHWMTFVWELAAWQAGLAVAPTVWPGAVLRVGGPQITADDHPVVVSCSLHPLGMPGTPAAGVLDFSDEVRQQPDSYAAAAADPHRTAWVSGTDRFSIDELGDAVVPRSSVGLVTDGVDAWTALREGLLPALLGAGSVVLATDVSADQLEQIRVAENIERSGIG